LAVEMRCIRVSSRAWRIGAGHAEGPISLVKNSGGQSAPVHRTNANDSVRHHFPRRLYRIQLVTALTNDRSCSLHLRTVGTCALGSVSARRTSDGPFGQRSINSIRSSLTADRGDLGLEGSFLADSLPAVDLLVDCARRRASRTCVLRIARSDLADLAQHLHVRLERGSVIKQTPRFARRFRRLRC
jgi:hypothetical protein